MDDEDEDDPEIKNDPIYVLDLQVGKCSKPLKFKTQFLHYRLACKRLQKRKAPQETFIHRLEG